MTKKEFQKIYDYEHNDLEEINMSEIDKSISSAIYNRSELIRIEQILDHKEETDNLLKEEIAKLYKDQKRAQQSYDDYCDDLKKLIETKDKTALKEYLDLIQKNAEEEIAANKMPFYLPPEKRGKLSVKDYDAYVEQRSLKAQWDCIMIAQRELYFMLKKEKTLNR